MPLFKIMDKEKFVRLNVAFKMPQEVSEEAIKLSKEVAEKEGVYFTLDGVDFIPHATIYSPEYPEKNLEKVIETAEKIAKELSPVNFIYKILKEEEIFSGSILVSFENSNEIKNIHEITVQKLNPFREGHLREKERNYSGKGKENIEKYGLPLVMNFYDPHITITSLKNGQKTAGIVKNVGWKIKKFKVDTIMVCAMGEHGTCRKIIKEFKLENGI